MGQSSKEFYEIVSRDDCRGLDYQDWLAIVAEPTLPIKGDEMNINDFASGSKTLKAADLQGRTIQATISDVTAMEFNEKGAMVKKPVLWFVGKEKGVVLNVTKRQLLTQSYGDETDHWRGKLVSLRPTKTAYEGKIVDSIELLPVTIQPSAPQQYAPAPAQQAPPHEWRQNAAPGQAPLRTGVPSQAAPEWPGEAPKDDGLGFDDSDLPF